MAKKYDYEQLEREGKTDVHVDGEIIKNFASDKDIDANYNFVIKNPFAKFFAWIFWWFARILVPVITKIAYNTRISGKKNLKNLKKSGAILIPNHVLYLDCLISAQCAFNKKLYIHTLESTMKVPVLSGIIKALGGMPIPTKPSARKVFINVTDQMLQKGNWLCIFPEGALWPNYKKIRPFKTGAGHFAVKNNVPLVPVCINLITKRGLFNKQKQKAVVHIGKPIYSNKNLEFSEAVTEITTTANNAMIKMNKFFKIACKMIDNKNKR